MTNLRTGLGALAATAALTAAGIGTAAAATHAPKSHGNPHATGPCAIQQAQVDYQDYAIVGDATGTLEDGVLTLVVDLRPKPAEG